MEQAVGADRHKVGRNKIDLALIIAHLSNVLQYSWWPTWPPAQFIANSFLMFQCFENTALNLRYDVQHESVTVRYQLSEAAVEPSMPVWQELAENGP
jgi:hypothetical protein